MGYQSIKTCYLSNGERDRTLEQSKAVRYWKNRALRIERLLSEKSAVNGIMLIGVFIMGASVSLLALGLESRKLAFGGFFMALYFIFGSIFHARPLMDDLKRLDAESEGNCTVQ